MSDDNQIQIPRSFVDLFIPPGRARPTEPREIIAQRYDLCEDMAQMLVEHARSKHFELGIDEASVLQRMYLGVRADGVGVTKSEARWVVLRLAELLQWPAPVFAPDPEAR